MTVSKLKMQIGSLVFVGQGEQEWVSKQMEKFVENIPKLLKHSSVNIGSPAPNEDTHKNESAVNVGAQGKPLAVFLREVNVSKQVDRFLATAYWLHERGMERIATGDIVNALNEAKQKKIGKNPSQTLANVVKTGRIEKDGDKFFVTEEGREFLFK